MSLEAVREQIRVILAGVAGIGVVHDYERLSTDWNTFLNHFKDAEGRINGCTITRTATPERWLTNIEYERVHEIAIRCYFGLQDGAASEIAFQALIERICDAFRGNDTLNGTCETTCPEFGGMAGRSGLQVGLVEPRMFGGVLCHYGELRLGAQIKGTR